MSEKVLFDALVVVAAALLLVGSLIVLSAWADARRYGPGYTRQPWTVGSGVVTGVVALALGGVLIAWAPDVRKAQERDLEQAFDQTTPTVEALHRYYPAQYLQALNQVKAASEDGLRVRDSVAGIVHDLVQSHLTALDGVSARNLFTMMLADAERLRGKDPFACVDMLNDGIASATTLLTPDSVGLDPGATAAMLRQFALHPAPPAEPIEPAEIRRLFAAVRPGLSPSARASLDVFIRTNAPPDTSPGPTCDAFISVTRFAVKHSPDDLRPLLAAGPLAEQIPKQEARGAYWRA